MKLYDYDEAAAELRVEKTWLQRNIRKFPRRKAGRDVHFTEADLERINELLHLEPEFGPLAKPVPAPAMVGVHPLAALKPLPARGKRAS